MIRPKYYQRCSKLGTEMLAVSEFPDMALTNNECIDVIESMNLGFCMGNALKYIWRIGEKKILFAANTNKKDAQKALFYVQRHIQNLYKRQVYNDEIEPWIVNINTVLVNYLSYGRVTISVGDFRKYDIG